MSTSKKIFADLNMQQIKEYFDETSDFDYSYWYVGYVIPYPLALIMFCAAILIELTIQTTLNVLNATAALLFGELEMCLEKISESNDQKTFWGLNMELDKWNRHHDLVCRLVEDIDSCFRFNVLITIGCAFINSSACASEFIKTWPVSTEDVDVYERKFVENVSDLNYWRQSKVQQRVVNIWTLLKLGRVFLHFLAMLIPSYHLQRQVSLIH